MMEWLYFGGVFLVGVISAGYGAAVGGGALLTVPFLIAVGLDPVQAVATSRFGSLGVSSSGLLAFGRGGVVDWELGWKMTFLLGLGSLFGTCLLLHVPVYWVKKTIALIILGVLVLLLIFPRAGLRGVSIPRDGKRYRLGLGLTFVLGIVSGFYQGGAGTMAAYIMILCFGQDFLESAGTRKLPFLCSNIISVIILFSAGKMVLGTGLALGVGAICGGMMGSSFALKRGTIWVRWLFLVVVSISGLRMLFW